jgi:hypothetical protein
LQPVDRERIIPWVYDASIHAIALAMATIKKRTSKPPEQGCPRYAFGKFL